MNQSSERHSHRFFQYPTAFLALGLLLIAAVGSGAPLDANHPELIWNSIETEHFVVHYHEGAERTANVVAKVAEEVYEPITSLYDYRPKGKVNFVIKDTDDYANGGAYYYNNKILIWCTALDYDLRGFTNWLRNVVTHEFTHIIQLGASRKATRSMPAFYFQWLGYEDEKRPDVLYGYPNVLVSYPFAMTTIPMWFAEGTAQSSAPDLEYDYWDTYRDMQHRVRALSDSLLPLNEMEVFGKTSLGNEGVYNHGFALVQYIIRTYGADTLRKLSREMKRPFRFDFNKAIKKVIGISGEQLYEDWKSEETESYEMRTAAISEHIVAGTTFDSSGYASFYPRWEPDGEAVYFSSNSGRDYLSQRSIYRKALDSDKAEIIAAGVNSPFDITSDGKWMVYSRIVRQRNESYYADIYLRDLDRKKEIRLTRSVRAMEPAFSPSEDAVVFVVNRDGTKDIAKLLLPAREQWKRLKPVPTDSVTFLTEFKDGSQCWRPKFSPCGGWVTFVHGRDLGRDIELMRPDGSERTVLVGGPGDQRDGAWSPDGEWLYYASDETGIFNLYRMRLADGYNEPITNVLGGAFMPDVREDGKIVYSQYGINGFEIRILQQPEKVERQWMSYGFGPGELGKPPVVTFDDTKVDTLESKGYNNPFENIFFVPRIGFDYGTFKPGVYLFSNDVLQRLNFFGGFAANYKKEFDAFMMLDFNALRPTIFLESYYLKRVHQEDFEDPYVIVGESADSLGRPVPVYDTYGVDYTFHLMEVDVGGRMRLDTNNMLELRGVWSRYQSFLTFEDLTTFHYTYFVGRYLQARLDMDYTVTSIRGNVHPKAGWAGQVTVAYEDNEFISGFEINTDKYTLQEVFTPYRYWRFEGDLTRWWNPVGEFVLQPRLRMGYLDKQVDPFMNLYAGGLHGMRGYSYYSLGGTRKLIGSLALRHPLFLAGRPKIGWIHFDGLFLGLFGDVGDTWREQEFKPEMLVKDVGVELRAKLFSWYGYPTAVTLAAARGLDTVSVTENGNTTVYDPEWKYYLTVLFEFETIFPARRTIGNGLRGGMR